MHVLCVCVCVCVLGGFLTFIDSRLSGTLLTSSLFLFEHVCNKEIQEISPRISMEEVCRYLWLAS
jgi:hypothetical protein